jgi:hypothetical protein
VVCAAAASQVAATVGFQVNQPNEGEGLSKQDIPEHVALQMEKLRQRNSELEVILDLEKTRDPLLLEITESLLLAELASNPAQSSPLDNQKVSGSKSRPDPGQNVRQARNQAKALRRSLENAVKRFHVAAEHGWIPPRPEPEPMRRCTNKTLPRCSAYGKRIPKYVGPRGDSRIEQVWCQVCGNKLGDA